MVIPGDAHFALNIGKYCPVPTEEDFSKVISCREIIQMLFVGEEKSAL